MHLEKCNCCVHLGHRLLQYRYVVCFTRCPRMGCQSQSQYRIFERTHVVALHSFTSYHLRELLLLPSWNAGSVPSWNAGTWKCWKNAYTKTDVRSPRAATLLHVQHRTKKWARKRLIFKERNEAGRMSAKFHQNETNHECNYCTFDCLDLENFRNQIR